MNKKNITRHKIMNVLNVFFIIFIMSAVVFNIATLYYSSKDVPYWNFTINASVISFAVSCILLLINRKIKKIIINDFLEEYLKEQNGEIVKEKFEEYLIKIEDKLFNVNIRFNKKGLFVLKQRASTAAEIEVHLFNGTEEKLKTSKYNSIWQKVHVDADNKIEII